MDKLRKPLEERNVLLPHKNQQQEKKEKISQGNPTTATQELGVRKEIWIC